MSERQSITVTVFDGAQYDGDWPDGTLQQVIDWFKEKLNAIPKEHRADTTCDVESSSGYEGSHYGRISISYRRQETDEEMAQRLARNEHFRLETEMCERQLLRQLQEKYTTT